MTVPCSWQTPADVNPKSEFLAVCILVDIIVACLSDITAQRSTALFSSPVCVRRELQHGRSDSLWHAKTG